MLAGRPCCRDCSQADRSQSKTKSNHPQPTYSYPLRSTNDITPIVDFDSEDGAVSGGRSKNRSNEIFRCGGGVCHLPLGTGPIVPPSTNSDLEKPFRRSSLPLATLSSHRTTRRTTGRLDQRMQLTEGSNHSKRGLSSEQISETSFGAAIPRLARCC